MAHDVYCDYCGKDHEAPVCPSPWGCSSPASPDDHEWLRDDHEWLRDDDPRLKVGGQMIATWAPPPGAPPPLREVCKRCGTSRQVR